MSIIANIFIITGLVIILLSVINFARTDNVFSSVHFINIANIYGMSLLIFGIGLINFNSALMVKILILILFNIIITIIVTNSIIRRAMINKILPYAKIEKLDYLSENESEWKILKSSDLYFDCLRGIVVFYDSAL